MQRDENNICRRYISHQRIKMPGRIQALERLAIPPASEPLKQEDSSMLFRVRACLIAAVCAAAVLAQSSKSAIAAPVAYAFVSTANPNNVYSLAVSSNGSFTHVGTASSPASIYHLSVTKQFLFGIDNASNIYSYSISSTGALKLVATTDKVNARLLRPRVHLALLFFKRGLRCREARGEQAER